MPLYRSIGLVLILRIREVASVKIAQILACYPYLHRANNVKMSRFLTLSLFILITTLPLSAQLDTLSTCEPDTAFLNGEDLVSPLPFVNDTLGEGLSRAACFNELYEQVIFVKVPGLINFGPLPLLVNDIKIDTVTNLPEGFSYICSSPDCLFPADSVGCILLTGIATPENTVGDYELKIGISISSSLGPIVAQLPDPQLVNGTYILKLRPEGDSSCLLSPTYDLDQPTHIVSVFPNPTLDRVTLEWESKVGGEGWIEVKNVAGQILQRTNIQYGAGLQKKEVSLGELQPGFYFIGVSSKGGSYWSKTLKL